MGHGLLHDGLNQLSMPEMNRGIYLLNFETNMKNIQYPSQKCLKIKGLIHEGFHLL